MQQDSSDTAHPIRHGAAAKPKSVLVAMSGGVDSCYAALALKREGFEVVGVHFKMGDFEDEAEGSKRCCSLEDARDAGKMAALMEIPFYVTSVAEEFMDKIVGHFVDSYARGLTPNPCVRCNPLIKWRFLIEMADKLGIEAVATGHHARVTRDPETGRNRLLRGMETKKEQSYFLAGLLASQLERAMLPVGRHKKDFLREELARAGLPVASKQESQDICFVGAEGYAGFVDRMAGERRPGPGNIVDLMGKVLGEHGGIHRFTIGQRKGLGLSGPEPYYVVGIDPDANVIVVGHEEDTLSERAHIGEVHWIAPPPEQGETVLVRIRYKSEPAPATLVIEGGRAEIFFERPQRSITPGQTAVVYRGEEVLGCGTFLRPTSDERGQKEPLP